MKDTPTNGKRMKILVTSVPAKPTGKKKMNLCPSFPQEKWHYCYMSSIGRHNHKTVPLQIK